MSKPRRRIIWLAAFISVVVGLVFLVQLIDETHDRFMRYRKLQAEILSLQEQQRQVMMRAKRTLDEWEGLHREIRTEEDIEAHNRFVRQVTSNRVPETERLINVERIRIRKLMDATWPKEWPRLMELKGFYRGNDLE